MSERPPQPAIKGIRYTDNRLGIAKFNPFMVTAVRKNGVDSESKEGAIQRIGHEWHPEHLTIEGLPDPAPGMTIWRRDHTYRIEKVTRFGENSVSIVVRDLPSTEKGTLVLSWGGSVWKPEEIVVLEAPEDAASEVDSKKAGCFECGRIAVWRNSAPKDFCNKCVSHDGKVDYVYSPVGFDEEPDVPAWSSPSSNAQIIVNAQEFVDELSIRKTNHPEWSSVPWLGYSDIVSQLLTDIARGVCKEVQRRSEPIRTLGLEMTQSFLKKVQAEMDEARERHEKVMRMLAAGLRVTNGKDP